MTLYIVRESLRLKAFPRRTIVRNFDNIAAANVAEANEKLYINREEGFIGTSLKKDEGHFVFGYKIAKRLLAFDGQLREIHVNLQFHEPGFGFQHHFHHLGFAVGVGREPYDACAGLSGREVVFAVARPYGSTATYCALTTTGAENISENSKATTLYS